MPRRACRLPVELAWTIGYDPKSFDPAKVDDLDSETVRYLTAGVLLRVNRLTQTVEPQLAQSWNLSPDGKTVVFKMRPGARFSDGSSLTSRDAAWSIRRVLLPAIAAPVADEFVNPGGVTVETPDPATVIVHLPQRVIGIAKVFDEIAIEPADRPSEGRVTSGPFVVADYLRSQHVRLRRNPYYWEKDSNGVSEPYASGVRLDILNNPEQETRLFLRGEYDLIDHIPPDYFELLKKKAPSTVRDLGPSLNTEQMWFNQSPTSPLPVWERSWFQQRAFGWLFPRPFTATTSRVSRIKATRLPPIILSRRRTGPGTTETCPRPTPISQPHVLRSPTRASIGMTRGSKMLQATPFASRS